MGLWFPEGSDLLVYVNCFAPDGRAEDSKFYALFYKDTELGSAIDGNAYLWAVPTHAPPAYQFNSRGGINSVRRLARGHYEARLPRMQRHALEPDKGGTVIVTAYGSGPGRCKVRGWIQEGNEIRAQVGCHHPDGRAVDSSFTLSFMRMPGTLAAAVAEDHVEGFYLWANALPTPSVFYQSDSYGHSPATIERGGGSAVGDYRVFLPEVTALKEKTAQVTAYGPGDAHCTISAIIDHAPLLLTEVDVHCFDRAGSFVGLRVHVVLRERPLHRVLARRATAVSSRLPAAVGPHRASPPGPRGCGPGARAGAAPPWATGRWRPGLPPARPARRWDAGGAAGGRRGRCARRRARGRS